VLLLFWKLLNFLYVKKFRKKKTPAGGGCCWFTLANNIVYSKAKPIPEHQRTYPSTIETKFCVG
jgi:hypothetical protein